ncbi:MAG: hypothetical protein AMJ53_03235 [Gammaproteobacteria bacterium SG8_11]|nr:MAG: hypothetical protein AMJ53_03235 [Gammaproteobacteria bacterium SG8_11]
MDVEHKYEPNVDFTSFKNFHWVQGMESQPEVEIDEALDQNIRKKISQQLIAKGYNESLTEQADFLINYQFITQDRVAVDQRREFRQPLNYKYPSTMNVDTYSYRTGSLILDVVDPQSRHVVWQGHVYGFLDVHTDPKKQDKRLDKAVRKLLSKFPP